MTGENFYNVTEWQNGDPYTDIGSVINSIIADIKRRQNSKDQRSGGKPGAVIYIPPGDYHLTSQVVIDISYLKIMGSGHGFTSSSIRFNTSAQELESWHELWPGGSRILVDLKPEINAGEEAGAAFYIKREGNPRLSSVEFSDFCIDGLHFANDGEEKDNIENTYINGKTGIYAASAQDSFRITGMGLVYLEHGVVMYYSDALNIHDNFIAECGNCIELRGWGQASKITDNLIGAGYRGYSIFAQNCGGLLISANNIFPRGESSIYFDGVTRSTITANRLHAFYWGMIILMGNCSENLISANHFLRDYEPWTPMQKYNNRRGSKYGIVWITGNYNSVIANHFSLVLMQADFESNEAKPVIIRIASGRGNFISTNHMVAVKGKAEASDACFSAQVGALLTAESELFSVTAVMVEANAVDNTVLDSGSEGQVIIDKNQNSFRPTPTL
ncbi:fructotransferase [Lachnospiraceae bacterium oral taxon 500]|nr:fructotransferase [Lachnospiraceae bacterium oral taxon 500]